MSVAVRKPVSVGLVALCALIGALAFASAPALAAGPPEPPEPPVTFPTAEIGSTTAVFEGVLNPTETGVVSWFWDYKAGLVCTGGGQTGVEGPAEVTAAPVGVGVEGLIPDTKYTVCLVAENEAKQATVGTSVSFLTAPEAPETGSAEAIGVSTATLKGILAANATAPQEKGTYEFLYRQSASECEGGERAQDRAVPVPAGTALGHEKEAVEAPIAGLAPGTQYTFCLLERNAAGVTALGAPVTFITDGAGITNEQASSVEAQAATLQADIDPNESETRYHFEYDTTPYTTSAPHGTSITKEGVNTEVNIEAGTTPVSAEVQLNGLRPGKTYYYRVVATDTIETFDGPGKAFTTAEAPSTSAETCPNRKLREEQPFGTALPDCRAYEIVSPENTNGQDATDPDLYGVRAAASGEAITYESAGAFAEPTGATGNDQFISRREPTKDRWSTQAITPLHDPVGTESNSSYEGLAFTPNLEEGIAETDAPLVEGAVGGLYLSDFASGEYRYVGEVLDPLGTSTDLSRVVFGEGGDVSEWVNGSVIPVSITNERETMSASVGVAANDLNPSDGRNKDVWHALSADGSRVFFTSPAAEHPAPGETTPGQLYGRVNIDQPHIGQEQSELNSKEECTEPTTKACTIKISAGHARYWGANAEGTKVFYTENEDLYEYDLPPGQVSGGQTTAITNGGKVQGVVQISEDGSYVYFVAKGALKGAGGVTLHNGAGEAPVAEEDNLYVYHEGGEPVFIATLASNDSLDWTNGVEAGPETNAAVVNPGGTRLAFISKDSLTGYDNQQAQPEECEAERETSHPEKGSCREVFLYDAETGELVCASCNPSGARPVGSSSLGEKYHPFAEYRAHNLLEDGTLFFDSYDALVPSTSDGLQNVYEFQDGHISAISNVAGGYESFFLDASGTGANGEQGRDVFFGTADQLLPQDTSDNVVVWDARIGGGFPAPPVPPSCDNGDSCKPPPLPQPSVFAPTGSATFAGPGDTTPTVTATVMPKKKTTAEIKAEKLAKALRLCERDKRKSNRQSCEKQARSKYGPTKKKAKAKRFGNDRRAER